MSNLWDDSVLIKAFNEAVSNYKTMHGNGSSENEKTVTDDAASVPAVDDEIRKEKRPVEEVDSGSFEFISSTDVEEANNLPSFEGNHQTYLNNSESNMHTENVPNPQEARDVPESSEGVDEYNSQVNQLIKHYNELSLEGIDKYNQLNQLGKQYSELETQRRNLLEQLNQVGCWNPIYRGSDYSSFAQLGTYPSYNSQYDVWSTYPSNRQCAQCGSFASSSEGCQVPKHQTYNPASSHPFPQPNDPAAVYPPTPPLYKPVGTQAYCHVVGPFSAAPGPVKGTGRMSPEDERVLRTAMIAAEKPLSSMMRKDPGPSNLNEGEVAESINSPLDLKVVLDAWYSAGFYTSKYLSEQQSMRKDGTDGSSS
ncbi:hypothetical protein Scep_027012 [Stephania cephalantha]|uniref:Survival Motor Neuron Gemin2-binding domain-containing protein n=1 Tax=Stephania cephalantha TaxID=152367 RepID=A0AAP0ETF9_9MAGN